MMIWGGNFHSEPLPALASGACSGRTSFESRLVYLERQERRLLTPVDNARSTVNIARRTPRTHVAGIERIVPVVYVKAMI